MQRKEGLVHVLSGDGNGKTTSAIGIAIRAVGRGMKVAYVQFLKGGLTGEIAPLEKLGITVVTKTKHCPRQAEHERMLSEKGFVIFCKDCFAINEKDRELTASAFAKAREFSSTGSYQLVILDEIFWAMLEKLVTEDEVLSLIKNRASGTELILTGRGSTPAVEAVADYVGYVQKKKHPFDKGTISRAGIDY